MGEPEKIARQTIDRLLTQAGWHMCDAAKANIHGALGVAIREFPLKSGHDFADYLLYVDGKAANLPVLLPPMAEQHRIVAEVDRRLSLIREVEAQVDANFLRARHLRQSILKTSFSCEISGATIHDV